MKQIVAVLIGDDHYEDTLGEAIQYLIEHEELSKEEIVGSDVYFCENDNVYSDKQISKIEDILYGEIENFEGDHFEKSVDEIIKLIKSVKYYNPFQKYNITEEDFEEIVKGL